MRIAAVAALFVSCIAALAGRSAVASDKTPAGELDWPHWRGPEMNMISRAKGLPDSWSRDGENVLWKREDLGTRSTPVTMNGKVYFLCRHKPETKEEQEKVVCLDAASGETVWEHPFSIFLSDVPDTRVAWSSVVADPESGNVFAMGVCNLFLCLDGETGKLQWQRSLAEEFGTLNTYGGRTNFPIVHEDLAIISAVVIGWGEQAKPTHRFIAFDKRNGQPVWFEGTRVLPYDTNYSTPVVTVIDGQSAMLFGSGDGGIHAFQTRTGRKIWSYQASLRGVNITPVVIPEHNLVVCGHGEENVGSTSMGALYAIDLRTGKEVWKHLEWVVGKSSPLHVDGRIYAVEDTGTLLIVDARTGRKIGERKLRGVSRPSPLYADGKIYCVTETGVWSVYRPTEQGVEEIVRPTRMNSGEFLGSPIVSYGRLYIPTDDAFYCVGLKDREPSADPRPAGPRETPELDDKTPVHVQVVPVESLLKPGQKQELSVRLYNARGQHLETVSADECELTIEGPGSLAKAGTEKAFEFSDGSVRREKVNVWKYATPPDAVHAAVYVTAKVGDLTGGARIRVVPELPWSFDFDDGEVPVTWVSTRYRHIAVDFDLYQKLKQADPLAGRAYLYLMTEYINNERDTASFDNSTPAQRWTDFLQFHGLEAAPPEQARQSLDAALAVLKGDNVVGEWSWSQTGDGQPRLTVPRGARRVEGNGVMVKITTIPKGTRSQGWMGQTGLSDYTIEGDLLGGSRDGKLPDMGLIGQRYAIVLMGAHQQLQIRTWHPQLRMASVLDFPWEADTWYRMKLRASVENGQAVLRGKVWPRDEDEPEQWTLEASDPAPNRTGSPGVIGDATNAEIFYDNLKVSANSSE
ncbi:MAG TPA: PQQ-binding-like beta-propeller repeat protein [Planctomycetaceae bacterium]|nr:PQQ-binding-like beta-propeller repeat protein [Planctomycetaceae bacterium]